MSEQKQKPFIGTHPDVCFIPWCVALPDPKCIVNACVVHAREPQHTPRNLSVYGTVLTPSASDRISDMINTVKQTKLSDRFLKGKQV